MLGHCRSHLLKRKRKRDPALADLDEFDLDTPSHSLLRKGGPDLATKAILDLARSAGLTLMNRDNRRQPPTIIDLTQDTDSDEESFQEQPQKAVKAPKVEVSLGVPQQCPGVPSSSTSAFLLERAQLERERLERQKRTRTVAGLEDDDEETSSERSSQRHRPSTSTSPPSTNPAGGTPSENPSSNDPEYFWDGELRQIANKHAEPRKDGKPTFRLTEILGNKSELAFAILSSYSLMLSWIYGFFNPSVPVILVAQPDESGQATIKNILPNWIRTTPFLRNGRGCMHMKFMLLFYKTGRLRVVISTANLADYDYRDIENTMWVQDVPLRPEPAPSDSKALNDFPAMMARVLDAVNVRPALSSLLNTDHPDLPLKSIKELRTRWNWSNVKVHLVPSIAGRHEGWQSVLLTGHTRMMKVVRGMGMQLTKDTRKELILECQGSSIGTYSTQWVNEFHWSAQGKRAQDWLDEPKTRRQKLPWPNVKIIFPSLETVRESALGEFGGGTIFCRRNQWAAAKFPRDLFYDSKSKAGRVLMHSKMIVASFRDVPSLASSSRSNAAYADSDTDSDRDRDNSHEIRNGAYGWAYVGSHNFTPSAWGTLSGSAFNPILNVVNYELGIMFPLRDEQAATNIACWERPPRKYKLGRDLPWMQEESAVLRNH